MPGIEEQCSQTSIAAIDLRVNSFVVLTHFQGFHNLFTIFQYVVASQVVGSIESSKPYAYGILWFFSLQKRMYFFDSIISLVVLPGIVVALIKIVVKVVIKFSVRVLLIVGKSIEDR